MHIMQGREFQLLDKDAQKARKTKEDLAQKETARKTSGS